MTDRYAVLWTRTASGPVKMGSMLANDRETRFSYDPAYAARANAPGFSLLIQPSTWGTDPYVHYVSEVLPLPPRLMALIPGRSPNNVQRRIYTQIVNAGRHPPLGPGFDLDWELLLLAGHSGIGHVDVFRDDREAEAHYTSPPGLRHKVGSRSSFWRFFRDGVQEKMPDADSILRLLGPTPSVDGMIPKLLVAIPDSAKWNGTIAEPGTRTLDTMRYTDVLLKIEDSKYPGVLALEALCYEVHRELGFEVPRTWHMQIDGLPVLAVERFDRDAHGNPIPMESFFSVYATGNADVTRADDAMMEDVAHMLMRLEELTEIDARKASLEVYRRFIAALFTGNGDLHLNNLAFLGGPDKVRVSPVYDPAPMRAWDRHNMMSALDFEHSKKGLYHSLLKLSESFGLTRSRATEVIEEIAQKTEDLAERALAVENVPIETRRRLAERIQDFRERGARSLAPGPASSFTATTTPTA